MRPAEYSTQAIIQAGQHLQETGRNVTGFALRKRVGGGNPFRLKQVWDEYQSGKAPANQELAVELPVDLSDEVAVITRSMSEQLAALAMALYEKAVKATEQRVYEITRSAEELRAQTDRELADAAHTVDGLESRLGEAKIESEGLSVRLLETQSTIQAQSIELAQLRERLAAAEQSTKVASAAHATEVAQINLLRETERTHLQQEISLWRGQMDSMQVQNADLLRMLEAKTA